MVAGRVYVVSAVGFRPACHAPRRAYRKHEDTKVGHLETEDVLSQGAPSSVRRP